MACSFSHQPWEIRPQSFILWDLSYYPNIFMFSWNSYLQLWGTARVWTWGFSSSYLSLIKLYLLEVLLLVFPGGWNFICPLFFSPALCHILSKEHMRRKRSEIQSNTSKWETLIMWKNTALFCIYKEYSPDVVAQNYSKWQMIYSLPPSHSLLFLTISLYPQ